MEKEKNKNTKERSLEIMDSIIKFMKMHPEARQTDVAKACGISRQVVHKHYFKCKEFIDGEISEYELGNMYYVKRKLLKEHIKRYPFMSADKIADMTCLAPTYVQQNIKMLKQEIPLSFYCGKSYLVPNLRTTKSFAELYYLKPKEELNRIMRKASQTKEDFTIGILSGTYLDDENQWEISIGK